MSAGDHRDHYIGSCKLEVTGWCELLDMGAKKKLGSSSNERNVLMAEPISSHNKKIHYTESPKITKTFVYEKYH